MLEVTSFPVWTPRLKYPRKQINFGLRFAITILFGHALRFDFDQLLFGTKYPEASVKLVYDPKQLCFSVRIYTLLRIGASRKVAKVYINYTAPLPIGPWCT